MKDNVAATVALAVRDLFGLDVEVVLTRPDEQFGDFSTNIALQIAKQLGQSPRQVAQALAAQIHHESVASVEVAGPGFLNITLTDAALWQSSERAMPQSLVDKTYVVEYSDPNPFKPLHAGHLYTTLVGDTISRLIEAAGARTVRLNYGGDVGLHVGKSMWAIVRKLDGEIVEKLLEIPQADRPSWLGERYVEGNNAYEDNETAKQEIIAANKRVYQLHIENDHESAFAQIYWTCRKWSYDYFAVLYEQLAVKPFDRYIPESEVTPRALETVRAQQKKGVYEESDGAVVFHGEPYGLHTRVFINSEGIPTYDAKDVGLSLTKWDDYHFDQSVIITANEQAQYMQVVIKSIEQYAPEPAQRTRHLTHGMVKLAGGAKMSSRKGNIVTALEILEAARAAGKETDTNPSEATILAAVKYALTKNRIGADIAYDPKESIALEGNSGPYLQYAHARARSILSKVEKKSFTTHTTPLESGEKNLLRKISEFTEVVELATNELMPHHVCTYLYELSQSFNRFYEKNRVIGDEREPIRLQLVTKYADTLKAGLGLLGISAPERM